MALQVFEDAAKQQAEATELGDYKKANKYYEDIFKAAEFIKSENAINHLLLFLSNPDIGVQLWAACFLLSKYELEGLKKLKEIEKENSIHSLAAATTIVEWKKGNLHF